MNWLEITIQTRPDEVDLLCTQLEELGVDGIVIKDEQSFLNFLENERQYWDYVDEGLLQSLHGLCCLQFYLADSADGLTELERLRQAFPERTLETKTVCDEDWNNNWRQYYKPVEVGKRLRIVPEWEEIPAVPDGRIVLRLDPGLIFGTGTHATTQMCLKALEDYNGKQVLDLGCGSGILGIAALLLGAENVVGCDIDEKAPKVARENAALNGITEAQFQVYTGNVLTDTKLKEKISIRTYNVILANIVADVIIAATSIVKNWLDNDGVFICSGIIDGREDEVKTVLEQFGFAIQEKNQMDNWHCFVAKKK